MTKDNIIKFTSEEYDIQAQQVKDLPTLVTPIQDKIDDLIAPAAKYDQKIAELTVAINQKMYEIATKSWSTWQENVGGSENFQSGPGGWNSGNGMGQFKS